jgi:hypothetical protein
MLGGWSVKDQEIRVVSSCSDPGAKEFDLPQETPVLSPITGYRESYYNNR